MIRAIIFDCFGVLTTDYWRLFLGSLSPERVNSARELNRQRDSGLISAKQFEEAMLELAGNLPPTVEDISPQKIVKNKPLIDFIAELKGRGFKIGMISNISSNWIKDDLLLTEEQRLFDDMIFSFEVGMIKPDARIFELACSRLGVEPSEALFIDDIPEYCRAAESLGMKSSVYTDLLQLQADIKPLLSLQ